MDKLMQFIISEDGAALLEYGLIAVLVSIAAVAALTALGLSVSSLFGFTFPG
jgi:Flp pilus assembly pilin Flp